MPRPSTPAVPPTRLAGLRPPPRTGDIAELDDWLVRVTERTDPAMSWLGVVFALLAIGQLLVRARDEAGLALAWSVWVIWAVLALDFLAKFLIAPAKVRFLRTHWLSLLGLLVPTLRVLSFLRLARLGRALPAARALRASTGLRAAGGLFRSRVAYLAGGTTIGVLLFADLGYVAERGPHSTLPTFGTALVWAAASVIGQSPTVTPGSAGGQAVMIACLCLGVVTISTLAGTVGAYLLGAPPGSGSSTPQPPPDPTTATETIGAAGE